MIKRNYKYHYKTLGEIDLSSNTEGFYNFYSVILNASIIKLTKNNNYVVSLTVIDDTIENQHAEISIESDDRNRLPQVTNKGMIIRVHRALKVRNSY